MCLISSTQMVFIRDTIKYNQIHSNKQLHAHYATADIENYGIPIGMNWLVVHEIELEQFLTEAFS